MVVSQDRGRWVAGSSGVSLVRLGASSGAGVVLQESIDDDFVHRFQACAAASDAIWHQGWLGCRTDGERGAWSSTMRTTWRTGWMPEPPVWRSVRAVGKTKTIKARRTLALPTR
jgi:hypothetical protein